MKSSTDSMIDLAEPLRRFVRQRVNDPHDADDIVQDVLMRALVNPDSLPPDERLAAWMFRTARNAIVDRYRARKSESLNHEPVTDSAEESTVVDELAKCLRCMIDRFDEPYRTALLLADVQGVSQQDVADRMGISLSGAKSRVQRARQQLHATLSACCTFERDRRGNVTDYQPNARNRQNCAEQGCDPNCE